MIDFEGKRIRLTYNSLDRWNDEVGNCLKYNDDYVVFQKDESDIIKYISISCVKLIEILGDELNNYE